MARDRNTPDRYSTALGRLMLGALVVMLLGLFLLWRIDSPRVERLRMEITDRVIPNFSAITAPVSISHNCKVVVCMSEIALRIRRNDRSNEAIE